ncbi:MAG: hypothetical protein WCB05_21650 [Candidatus Sulfotelmatobacter sp.]
MRPVRRGGKTNIATGNNFLVARIWNLAKAGLLGAIVLSALWNTVSAEGQISPGPLSRAHQSINGLTDCTHCHEISPAEQTYKCLSCHTEIASRIGARKGLHASYNPQTESSQKCASCHSEHNGLDFTIIKFDIKTFDHSQAGYKLEGKHAGVECSRCHLPSRISERERSTIKVKDLSKTYLGVSPDCANCHQDSHKGRLGSNCLQCHSFTDWKDVAKFDHSLTRYPLSGLHADVACRRCHTPGPDQQTRYSGLAFRDCNDCHSDPHRGRFTDSCQSCHRTSGWKTIVASEMDQVFDHSQTKYPLLGKHSLVECDRCHARGDFKKPLAFQKCSDCHRPDPHRGQFDKLAGGSECSNCHTLDGFRPSTFGVKAHAATAYPLEGKHATLRCGQCHIPKGAETVYKMKSQYCYDCHADAHAAQFAAAPHFNRCEQCHNLQRFLPSTFSLRSHSESPFALTGSHSAVACNSCHKESHEFAGKRTTQYRWQDLTCTSCHVDPHQGRFKAVTRRVEDKGIAVGCGVCHSTRTWTDLSLFDHFETAFPLTGAHEFVKCSGCHKPASPGAGLMNTDFKRVRKECEGCHADVHGQQFADHGITACIRCHDSKAWRPSLFDHAKQTSFSLEGAHREVPCAGCHKLTRVAAGKAVLFYKPTPKECVACHGHRELKTTAN